jgi:cobalt-zinc-cadmium resistance protein CzcA
MLAAIVNTSLARRGLVIILVLALMALGAWNFTRLPIDAVPDITNVQVAINTAAPGYTPLEVEQRISFPMETAMAGMPRLSSTRSVSRYGLSQVTIIFEEGTDIYFARQQVSERIAAVRAQLPPDTDPTLGPIATGLGEIFMFTVDAEPGASNDDGSAITPMDLRVVHDWIIRPQLLRVPGVVEVNPIGGYKHEIQVEFDSIKLLSYKLTQSDLIRALETSNKNRGAGFIEYNGAQWLIRMEGQAEALQDIADIVVGEYASVPIRVKDVAKLTLGEPMRSGAATQDGHEVVMSTVFMLIGENSRAVARNIAVALEQIQASLPAGVTATAVYNRTTLVDKTLTTVQTNLVEGALLVVAVLFLLLGNIRAALLTAAIIPIAMLMTITGMVQTRVSANLMSLGALDFGLIVDGTVIIVENCLRRLSQESQSRTLPLQERLALVSSATQEVMRPALFGVFIITAVYIPILSLTGVEGKMFHPMAITVITALLSGMLLSLTFVPACVALLFRKPVRERANPIIAGARYIYQPMLNISLRLHWLVILLALGLVLWCYSLFTRLGSEFVPNLDEGDIAMHALRIPGTSLQQAVQLQLLLETEVRRLPEVERVFSKIGSAEVATDPMPPSVADTFIMLKPRDQWPDPLKSKQQVVADLEAIVTPVPGNRYEFLQPIQMRFNELLAGVRTELAVKVFGDDFDQLIALGDQLESAIAGVPGAADVAVEQATGLPVMTMSPQHDVIARFGISLQEVQDTVAVALGGVKAGNYYEGDRRSDIIVRQAANRRENPDTFSSLPIMTSEGEVMPLGELVNIQVENGYNQIYRENGKRRVVVAANVRGRDLGSFVEDVQRAVEANVEIPAGYWVEYGGTYEQLQSASQRLSIVVPVTLVLILGLLIMALGSLRDSLIIFTGVPLALTGGVLALVLRDIPFSISAGIGFIALSGIAVLNGLVMLTFIRRLHQQSNDLRSAIIEGATSRLRPVLMTALVASLGFVPMALNTGIGSEVQRPLATVVIGGIVTSTLLTLFVLPALYRLAHFREAWQTADSAS